MADRCKDCLARVGDGVTQHASDCPQRAPELIAEVERLRKDAEELLAWATRERDEAGRRMDAATEVGPNAFWRGKWDTLTAIINKLNGAEKPADVCQHAPVKFCEETVIGDADKERCGMALPCPLHGGRS